MPQETEFDVAVVGGGPAGLMAAIAARTQGASTVLIEKGEKLGRKLGISGGGRCNVTNIKPLPELMENIPGNPRFLRSALTQFGNRDIISFVEGLGIKVKEEDHGRVFPVSDSAATVVRAVVSEVYSRGVVVMKNAPVQRLIIRNQTVKGLELRDGSQIGARSVIVATGGCSVPQTGSTGDGYPWAQAAGHTLVRPYPTAVPLTSSEPFICNRSLQGLSFHDVDVSVWAQGYQTNIREKCLTTETGDLLFTHLGLSGPAALRCSHYVSTSLLTNPDTAIRVTIDFLPEVSRVRLEKAVEQGRKTSPRRFVGKLLSDYLPYRLVQVILQQLHLPVDLQLANLSNQQMNAIADMCKRFSVAITGTLPLAQATVTGGGISVKEIHPSTMASKLCVGLYFAGEVMDVHAHTGGYNITVAFSTGHLAGTSAAAFTAANS